ncbi:MAG: SDR family NAD(P)-dependent oxidoreductase [Chloroflexi bacterium]|nr:SDR family NAD(P)-dependent oxidoreductase [Chloroflexota bacterium]
MDLGLRDRVVLITGGGGGAGPTIGRAFAAEGAVVALHHRGGSGSAVRAEAAAAEIVAGGGRAIAVAADLASSEQIGAMIDTIEGAAGPVGVLVTATSAYRSEQLPDIDDASWEAVLGDVLGATFRSCRAVVPGMQAAGWGRIVNIAARSGLTGVARATHYAAAKAGIIGFTASPREGAGSQRHPRQRGRPNPDRDPQGRRPVDPG